MQNGLLRVEQKQRKREQEEAIATTCILHSPLQRKQIQNCREWRERQRDRERQAGGKVGRCVASGRVASARHALTSANFRVLSHVSLN